MNPPPPADPGERRLDRPPSDRFLEAPPADAPVGASAGSPARAAAAAVVTGLLGVVATIILGGVLAFTAGLLVLAAAIGWGVASAVLVGARGTLQRVPRVLLAVIVTAGTIVAGQVGLWLYAQAEGGVLSLVDHLVQTYGPLVPLQAVFAIGVTWWTAR